MSKKAVVSAMSKNLSKNLEDLRTQIDAVDTELVALLNRRATMAQDVGRIKARENLQAYVPERERKIIERVLAVNSGPLPNVALKLIFKEIISAALSLENPLQVAYLGPEATFTHEASKQHFGLSAKMVPCPNIADVFSEVEAKRCAYGVVPLENSTEGMASHTLERLESSSLKIVAEKVMRVRYHILSHARDLLAVRKVYAHPQALELCRVFLEQRLPHAVVSDVSSTLRAAQLASEDASAAAIATDMASSLYDLPVLAVNSDSGTGTFARFLVLGTDHTEPTGCDRTSLMFSLKDSPGVLARALSCFAAYNINMSRIESRPAGRQEWEHAFFVDIEGHQSDAPVHAAIEALKQICVSLSVFGSYPRGSF